MSRATRAAAALKQALGVEAKLIRGSNGIFEVAVDGEVVAAKALAGFPNEEAVVAAVKVKLDSTKSP